MIFVSGAQSKSSIIYIPANFYYGIHIMYIEILKMCEIYHYYLEERILIWIKLTEK